MHARWQCQARTTENMMDYMHSRSMEYSPPPSELIRQPSSLPAPVNNAQAFPPAMPQENPQSWASMQDHPERNEQDSEQDAFEVSW